MPDTIWVLIMGLGLALFFLVLGVLIRFYEAYGLISGYNTAPPEEQARYDIKGLGDHLGNGLLNLAVLIAGAADTSGTIGMPAGCATRGLGSRGS